MKITRVDRCMLTILLLGSTAAAQNDWQPVRALPPETRIKITVKHGHGSSRCLFREATDSSLTCAESHGLMDFQRENVRAVYLGPERHHSTSRTAIVGAGVFVPAVILGVFAGPVPVAIGTGVVGATFLVTRHFVPRQNHLQMPA
jgi:hypothetical protein